MFVGVTFATVFGTRFADVEGGAGDGVREPGVGDARRSRRPRAIAARRAASGVDPRRLDDLGMGPNSEGAVGDVDARWRAAGLGARQRADSEADTETRCGAARVHIDRWP